MRFNAVPNWPGCVSDGIWRKGFIVAIAILMALPRFGHTTPDSAYYIALADYFKEHGDRLALVSPYAFRWVVPWLASRVPWCTSAAAIALCSLIAFAGTSLCLDRLLRKLRLPDTGVNRAMVVFLCSFPAFNYGAAVLTDSMGMFVLTAAMCALVEGRVVLLILLLIAGAGVRETTLVMVPVWLLFHGLQRESRGLILAVLTAPAILAAAALSRWYFSDLPAYGWQPSWSRLTANLTRPVSWATVLLSVTPILLMAWPGLRRFNIQGTLLRHVVLAAGLPGIALLAFSVSAAFMSGRFVWPLYLALAPLVAVSYPRSTSGQG